MRDSVRISSVLFIIILLSSSFSLTLQNFSERQNHDYVIIKKAFAASSNDIRQIGSYSIFGLRNIVLETNVTVTNGSAGVQNVSHNMQLPANAEINIGSNSKFVDPTSTIAADTVLISNGATVQNVYYNQIQNSGTILGLKNTPLQLPLVQQLPPFPRSTPGTIAVNVPASTSSTLAPGQYGSISIGDYGILHITGGIYNVTSISAGKNAQLLFDAPSQIVVQNPMSWKKGSVVGPSISSLHARDILIFVGGNTTINQNTTDTDFGKNAVVKANIYAPTGTITMEKGTVATGALIANSVVIKRDSVIVKDSAFGLAKITWIPSSLNTQAKPFTPIQLNFTSNQNIQNASVAISSEIGTLVTAPKTLANMDANALHSLSIKISIPPNTSSGWHNGTITLFANNVQLSNSFFLNILVPTITSQTVQTSTGNLTYVATPSSSPFFTNTYDVVTYFTFTNGTTVPIRAYYDIFTNLSTITPVSLHSSTSESSNVFMATYDYFESMMNKLLVLNFWQPHEASAVTQASTCTNYAITYHFKSYPGTISNDLAVATSALNANQNPLIIRNDISWADVDKGSFDSSGNWVPNYDNSTIDNYFNNVITSGKQAVVILGVHSPPGAIAAKGTNIFGQPYAQYAYANAANAFISYTIDRIKTLGALDRVQSWQIDNEPNTHPMLKSSSDGGIFTEVVDWQTTSSALNLWSSTVKTLDHNKPIIINVYQASPQDVIPKTLLNGVISFSIKPFDNLLPSSFASSQQLATNIGIMGFDVYPEQWADPIESLTTGFNEALLQAQNQFTDVQNSYAFSGRWGIVEMPGGPNPHAVTSRQISASDVSSMINATRNSLISGQPPALIGLFQLRAPNDFSLKSLFPDFSNTYGLITDSTGQTNSDFFTAIQSSVVQNCSAPTSVFLNDQFTSDLEGWSSFAYPGYSISLDSSTGQPAPSAHLSGDAWFGICSQHGMEKQVDVSSYSGGPLTLALNWRAASALDYVTTNANVEVDDASNGTPLFSQRLLPDSGYDTNWQYYSKDISSYVSGVHKLQVDLFLYDCWIANWSQNNWYDNVSLFTGTTPPSGVILNTNSPTTPAGYPYFYPETNQSSVNVTRPGSVTLPLGVEWEQGWTAKPVSITLGNLTNTGITYSITSVQNTTGYQLFNVTLDVPSSTPTNQYLIPISVNEIGTNHTRAQIFSINVR